MAFYFAGFFFLWELIFADRGQSAKFAKIRTRKILMLHGMGQYRQHKFFKKSKIPLSNLSSIYSAELYLGQKKKGMATAIFLNIFL